MWACRAHSEAGALTVAARGTVLATGGSAALWARSTNPTGSVGVGLALAHAAGARLADLEFMQFHPTALVSASARDGFLITEAVRGEGALLVDAGGERFVDELAPRDEVALAIEQRLREQGTSSVGLDLRPVDLARFPNIADALAAEGIDPGRDLVPVAPAAHYTMGGVATDLDGRASLDGLLAVGECACTGLHGANRLASNSLAECFVLGRRAAQAVLDSPRRRTGTGRGRARAPARPAVGRHPRRALASRGPAAHARGAWRAGPRPLPAGAPGRRRGAGANREPGRPPARGPPRDRSGDGRPARAARPRRACRDRSLGMTAA